MKKVLFVTYGGGHVRVVIPLAERLISQGYQVRILALTEAELALSSTGLPFMTIGDYIEIVYRDEEIRDIYKIGDALADKYHNSAIGLTFSSTSNYYGVSMYCLINEHGIEKANKIFVDQERKAFCPIDFMSRVLDYEKPGIVINTCFVRMEKAAVCATKLKNIPVLSIQDIHDSHLFYDGNMDYHGVLNESEFEFYIKTGFSKNKLRVVGQPAFDSLWKIKVDRSNLLCELGLDPAKKTILWLADGCPWVKAAFDAIKNVALELPQYNFIFKLHPASNDAHDFLVNSENCKLLQRFDINKLIAISDLSIGQVSTTILQSIIMGKKLLRLTLRSTYDEEQWERYSQDYPDGISKMIDYPEELKKEICLSLEDEFSEKPYETERRKLIPVKDGIGNTIKYIDEILALNK